MPTIGWASRTPASEPQLGAPPNGKTLASAPATQYPVWFFWTRHALGALGGAPAGPANAVMPESVGTRTSPSAAEGAAKWATEPTEISARTAPLAGLSTYNVPEARSIDHRFPPARMGEPAAPVAGPTQPSEIDRCATSIL